MVESRELRLPYQYLVITVLQAITKVSYSIGSILMTRNVNEQCLMNIHTLFIELKLLL